MNLLTRKQTQILLHCSPGTLINWEREGILKPSRIGKRVYYSEEKIKKALEEK